MLTRRSFFGGTIALAAASRLAFLPALPKIWCDGEHCDADGLEAMFAGKPFEVSEEARAAFSSQGAVRMIGADIGLRRTLWLPDGVPVHIEACDMIALDGFDGFAMLRSPMNAPLTVINNHFNARNMGVAGIDFARLLYGGTYRWLVKGMVIEGDGTVKPV